MAAIKQPVQSRKDERTLARGERTSGGAGAQQA